jgi:hypothetical protein
MLKEIPKEPIKKNETDVICLFVYYNPGYAEYIKIIKKI